VGSQVALNATMASTQEAQKKLNEANARTAELNAKATEATLPAIAQKAKVDLQQGKIDEKMIKYDNLMRRVQQGTGIISDAASAARPLIPRTKTKEVYIDKRTGEILP